MKFYSDSTLRLSDKSELLADVKDMSGGTIGAKGNAIQDDDNCGSGADKSEIIVVVGKNFIKQVIK